LTNTLPTGPFIHLEFIERFRANYLLIIEPRRRLLMVEKVINVPSRLGNQANSRDCGDKP
jgi:hypothetical protein